MNVYLIYDAIYLGAATAVTAGVTALLWRQTRVILLQAYPAHREVVKPLNRLQVAGYFLLNAANVVFVFGLGPWPADAAEAANDLCLKIAWVLLVITGTYFLRLEKIEAVCRQAILQPPQPTPVQ